MTAMIDATCKHCGKRFGWCGEIDDPAPPCPGCGKLMTDAVQEVKSAMEMIGPQPKTGAGFFKTRRASGLSFSQAVVQLGITKDQLEDIEYGHKVPSQVLLETMQKLYNIEFVEPS